jgi:septal ring factor EnvC (AmiA/AmiB activator)
MIASWVSQFGLTKPLTTASTGQLAAPQAASVAQPAQAIAPAPPPAAPSLDPQQIQRIERDLAQVRGAVEQLGSTQDQISRDIAKLQTANQEILEKISPPAPRPSTTQGRVRTPMPRPSSAAPMPLH